MFAQLLMCMHTPSLGEPALGDDVGGLSVHENVHARTKFVWHRVLAPLAIADRRSPEVRNTSAVPVGERLIAKTPPPGPHVKLCV